MIIMFTRNFCFLYLIILSAFVNLGTAAAGPVIFHSTASARPGEAVSIQGAFSASAQVYLKVGEAGSSQRLTTLTQTADHCLAQLPPTLPLGLYQLWVEDNGQRSAPSYLNRAQGLYFDSPSVAPGGTLRVVGRDLWLVGGTPRVRLVAQSGDGSGGAAQVRATEANLLRITVPASLVAGQVYDVYVSNGYGESLGETLAEQTLTAHAAGADYFQLGVGWASKLTYYQNVYDVRTDPRLTAKAAGNGLANDLPALQSAIDRASADGGGIVYLPAGTYNLVPTPSMAGLFMRSRVTLQGAGKAATSIRYGFHTAAPGWNPDLNWGIVWNGANQAGLADLALLNVDNAGRFVNNVSGKGNEVFLQRIRVDLNQGDWLWLAESDRLVISNSEFTQGVDKLSHYHGIVQLDGCQHFVVAHNTFSYAVDGLNLNRTSQGIFEDNTVNRDGSARWPAALNLINHVLILNFAENIAVLRNTFRVVNGPSQNNFDGETIMAEGGGPVRPDEDAGTATGATATTLQDNSKRWPALLQHPVVAIVRGPGMGQWRAITGRTATTLTLARAWDVLPQAGSRYAIFNWGARNWLVQGNTMEGNLRGITLYHNASTNVNITDNTLTNSGSIDLTPVQSEATRNGVTYQEFMPCYDIQLTGNRVADTDGSNGVFMGVHTVQYLQRATFGTSVIGLEVRRNTLTAHTPNVPAQVDAAFPEGYLNDLLFQSGGGNYVDEHTPAILGSIFQDNTAINCAAAVYLNSGAYNTLLCNTKLINSPTLLKDSPFTGINHASVNTGYCPAAPPSTGSQPPVADPKTNPVILANAPQARLLALTASDFNPQGYIMGFTLVALPTSTQGTVYVNRTPARLNQRLTSQQADSLAFRPASNYAGSAVFAYTATNHLGINSQAANFVVPVAAPLPVTLVEFRAESQGLDALLSWRTASEVQNSHFVVERSFDARQFVAVGTVPGQGGAATYRFVDRNLGALTKGRVYYRLQQVDTDASTTYSPVQVVTFGSPAAAVRVRVYPNPATSELHATLPAAGASLVVYTSTGQPVLQARTDTTEATLQVADLPDGSYMLLVQPDQEGSRNYYHFTKHHPE